MPWPAPTSCSCSWTAWQQWTDGPPIRRIARFRASACYRSAMRYAMSKGAASTGALAIIGGATTLATSDAMAWGWAGIGVGLSVWILAITIDGREWWRAGAARTSHPRWVPMHVALTHIITRSRLAFGTEPAPPAEVERGIGIALTEALSRGELKARGVETDAQHNALTATTVPIPEEFWHTAFIQPFGEVEIADDDRCVACRDGSFASSPRRSYRAIVLDELALLRLWPSAGKALLGRENTATIALSLHRNRDHRAEGAAIIEMARVHAENEVRARAATGRLGVLRLWLGRSRHPSGTTERSQQHIAA